MLAIAGKTAGPNWLNFFEGTHGYPAGTIGQKTPIFFKNLIFSKCEQNFHWQRCAHELKLSKIASKNDSLRYHTIISKFCWMAVSNFYLKNATFYVVLKKIKRTKRNFKGAGGGRCDALASKMSLLYTLLQ